MKILSSYNEIGTVSEEKMKIIRKEGQRCVSIDSEIEVTSYIYNGRVYVDDIKKIGDDGVK